MNERVQILKEELTRACDLVEQNISLITDLFLPRGVTGTITHLHSQGNNHPNRSMLGIGMGIAILTGIFSAGKVFQSSSEVTAVKENKTHIISVVRRLAQKQETVIKILEEFQNLNSKLEWRMDAYTFEARIVSASYAMTRNAKRLTDFIQNMKVGMFKRLAGKLAPDIMDGDTFHEAMQVINRIASKRGHYPLPTILSHIFELPRIIYVHENRKRMDIIAHIPITKRDTKREIHEILPLPFILKNKGKDTDRTWGIKRTSEYIIIDMDQTSTYSMNKAKLATCLAIGFEYYCQQPVINVDSLDRSCEAYLFQRRMKESRTVCAMQLAQLEEQVVSIDPLTTIVYGKEGFVRYTCYDLMGNKKMNDKEMKVVTRIRTPEEQTCAFNAGAHKWHTAPSLEVEARSRIVNTNVKLSNYLSIPWDQFQL